MDRFSGCTIRHCRYWADFLWDSVSIRRHELPHFRGYPELSLHSVWCVSMYLQYYEGNSVIRHLTLGKVEIQ